MMCDINVFSLAGMAYSTSNSARCAHLSPPKLGFGRKEELLLDISTHTNVKVSNICKCHSSC